MNSKSKKAFAERLNALMQWRATAEWYAGEPGAQRSTALSTIEYLDAIVAELGDEIVELCATPAERTRSAARAARAAARAAATISYRWQQTDRRKEHIADQREAARDRQSAIARVWRSL